MRRIAPANLIWTFGNREYVAILLSCAWYLFDHPGCAVACRRALYDRGYAEVPTPYLSGKRTGRLSPAKPTPTKLRLQPVSKQLVSTGKQLRFVLQLRSRFAGQPFRKPALVSTSILWKRRIRTSRILSGPSDVVSQPDYLHQRLDAMESDCGWIGNRSLHYFAQAKKRRRVVRRFWRADIDPPKAGVSSWQGCEFGASS